MTEKTVHVGVRPSEAKILVEVLQHALDRTDDKRGNYAQNLKYLIRVFEAVSR